MSDHYILLAVQKQVSALVAERDAQREQVAAVVTERDALRAEIARMEAERDEAKAMHERCLAFVRLYEQQRNEARLRIAELGAAQSEISALWNKYLPESFGCTYDGWVYHKQLCELLPPAPGAA